MNSTITDISNIIVPENYNPSDLSLLNTKDFVRTFGETNDHVELHIYSPNDVLLFSNYDFKGFGIPGTLQGTGSTTTNYLTFSPDQDLVNNGYTVGTFNVQYNILRAKIVDSVNPVFFITEISSDRTEIRAISNNLPNVTVESGSLSFISEIQTSLYYKDFLLNFGSNSFIIANNLALDKNTNPYSVLFKLYQPLPINYDINSSFWVVEELSNSYAFKVLLEPDPVIIKEPRLRGPNFDIQVDHEHIKPSDYFNYQQIVNTNSLTTYQQLLNLMNNSSIQINIDYTNFSNFVHFSSAVTRLSNFFFKVQKIENYTSQFNILSGSTFTPAVSASMAKIQSNINTIIQKFDGYDNFLYYSNDPDAWPKTGSLPYSLLPSTSSIVTTWLGSSDSFSPNYGGQNLTASIFDRENPNNLLYSVPEFIEIDDNNQNYVTFLQMIGQHFDSIWVYIKAVGDIYLTNNSLTKGISKDLVFEVLRSFGIKLYNGKSDQPITQYFLGITDSGSYLPPTSSFETLVTSSAQTIPGQDQVKETFKRIYHNLPYLLKTKGTKNSLRAISSIYGVPSTILRINEYGGMDKSSNTIQYSFDRFSYAWNFDVYGNAYFSCPWVTSLKEQIAGNSGSFDEAIEVRVKPDFTSSVFLTQSILSMTSTTASTFQFGVNVNYFNVNNNPYGKFQLAINNGSGSLLFSSPAIVPFYVSNSFNSTSWWNVLVQRATGMSNGDTLLIDYDGVYIVDYDLANIETGLNPPSGSAVTVYTLFIKNKIDGRIGFQASTSIFVTGSLTASYNKTWSTTGTLNFGTDPSGKIATSGTFFHGKMQEARLWAYPITESAFNFHVLNPESIEGDFSGSFYNYLDQWYPLGNDLVLTSASTKSVQPDRNASVANVSMSVYGFSQSSQPFPYSSGSEMYYGDVPVAGYSAPVTDKIRIAANYYVTGSVLSPKIRTEPINPNAFTKDIHLIDASFSPVNELDEDIIAAMGSRFTIDDYIGDPADSGRDYYANLELLKTFYFGRYTGRYRYSDYIKLIKYFDNSLFKMLKDFVAGRSSIDTGLSIRPTILERPKIKRYEPSASYVVQSGSISIGRIRVVAPFDSKYKDRSDAFTGLISGAFYDENKYFVEKNYNPYLTYGTTASDFYHSDKDVFHGNVPNNRTATIHRTKDSGSVTYPAQIPDSNYTTLSQVLGRYEGSKASSFTYNFYTSASPSYSGDMSYGKTAAVSSNVLKFAWIKQFSSSSLDFFDKTKVTIKYLVDQSSSLIELSKHNANVVEVQNTFRSHTPTIVSLTDVLNPTNQSSLDGNKNIFEGGFNYYPIVFRESAENLSFKYLNSIQTSASVSLTAIQSNYEYNTLLIAPTSNKNIDTDVSLGGYTMTLNGVNLTTGQFALTAIFPFASWSYSGSGGGILTDGSSITLPSGNGANTIGDPLPDASRFVYQINPTFLTFNNTSSNDSFSQYVQLGDGSYAYLVPRTSQYHVHADVPFNFSITELASGPTIIKAVAILEQNPDPNGSGSWTYVSSSAFSYVEQGIYGSSYAWDATKSNILLDNNTWNSGADSPIKCLCTLDGNVSITSGNYLRLSFFIIRLRDFLPTTNVDYARISFKNRFARPPSNMRAGTFTISDNVNTVVSAITGSVYTQGDLFSVSGSISGSMSNVLIFSDSASILYNKIQFDESNSPVSSLYSSISYPFNFQVGDVIRFGSYYQAGATYYWVTAVTSPITGSDGLSVTQDLQLTLDKSVVVSSAISGKFVIFRRLPDETSVILDFAKNPGNTSKAVLIPYNLDLDVKSKVADIFAQINQSIST